MLFHETALETFKRWVLGTAWALRPSCIRPACARPHVDLRTDDAGPRATASRDALDNPPGLCGIVHDLSVETLVEAHRRGLYTFAHFGPLKWMAPPERCVLDFDDFHMSKRLRSRLRQNRSASPSIATSRA